MGGHFCYILARTFCSEPLRSAVFTIPVIQKIILELLAQQIFNPGSMIIEPILEEIKSVTETICPLGRSAEVSVNEVMETVGPLFKNCEGA
jgi:hypothetical protein